MRGSGAVALLTAARCFVEAVSFTAIAAIAHAGVAGRDPLPVLQTVLAVFGGTLILATLLREAGTERRSATVIVVTLAASGAWGLSLPMRDPDGLAVLSRIVAFGLIGEALLWRVLSIARGALRWTDARNAAPIAAVAIAAAVLGPVPVDRAPFAPLALLVVAVSGLALSLARTTEELALSRGSVGSVRASSATSATVVVAAVAIVAAALVPFAQDAFASVGSFLGPIVEQVLLVVITPFALIAGWLIELLRPLVSGRLPDIPANPLGQPRDDEELLRQIQASRPYVFGAVELVIVGIAALVGLLLLERMLRERRLALPQGVALEREHAEGIGFMATLRALRPRRGSRRAAPRDDGTSAGALRLLYWRFLALAERRGAGWREAAETPREHAARITSTGSVWRAASPIVAAFEDLRYDERDPDAETLVRARRSLESLEAPPRAS